MAARGLLVLSRIVAGVVRTVGGGLIGHRFIPLEVLQVVQELSRDYTTKRQNVHSRAAYISVKFAILKSTFNGNPISTATTEEGRLIPSTTMSVALPEREALAT